MKRLRIDPRTIFILLIITTAIILMPVCSHASDQLYDLQAVNTEISDVLNALSLQSGANIVVGSGVTGKITVQLKQVSFNDALEYIVRMHGFEYIEKGSTYLVAKPDAKKNLNAMFAEEEPSVTETCNVNYLSAQKLQEMLTKVYPGLTVTIGPDTLTPFLNQSSSGSSSSYSSSSSSSGQSTTNSTGSSSSNDTYRTSASCTLILQGTEKSVQAAIKLVKQLDKPRPQVRIEVMVLDLNENASKELGVKWTWNQSNMSEEKAATESSTSADQSSNPTIHFGAFYRSPFNLTATITAMVGSGSARILAKPNLSILDSEKGFVLIGDRLLYPKLISYAENGTPIYDKEEVEVGIRLQVVPRISDDGLITLNIYPQVSTVTGLLKTSGGDYPQISTRETQTTVRVRNGEQIAIGGLFKEEELLSMSKIPLLGDLPILGNFFKSRTSKKVKSEVVIILTPQILSDVTPEAIGN